MNGVDYSASIMVRPTSMPRFVRVRCLEKMKREERLQRRIDLYRQRRDKEMEEERQGEVHVLHYVVKSLLSDTVHRLKCKTRLVSILYQVLKCVLSVNCYDLLYYTCIRHYMQLTE